MYILDVGEIPNETISQFFDLMLVISCSGLDLEILVTRAKRALIGFADAKVLGKVLLLN